MNAGHLRCSIEHHEWHISASRQNAWSDRAPGNNKASHHHRAWGRVGRREEQQS